jgi:peptidyl-prolyl cis-trans isomerase A (cyclophilin A)
MTKIPLLIIVIISYWTSVAQSQIKCEISTTHGIIVVELYPEKAPKTVANFLRYVDNQWYDSCFFFRVCTPENESDRKFPIEVIQGGDLPETKRFSPIEIETTKETGLTHLNGTISMARDTPNSAQSDFFICINPQPELDSGGKRNPDGYGFAAFGKVLEGMDIVTNIQKGENKGQILVEPVLIKYIRRKD